MDDQTWPMARPSWSSWLDQVKSTWKRQYDLAYAGRHADRQIDRQTDYIKS